MFFPTTITTLEEAKTHWYELVRVHFFDEPTLKAINIEYQALTAQLRAAEHEKTSASTAIVVQSAPQHDALPPQPPQAQARRSQRPKRTPTQPKQRTPKQKRHTVSHLQQQTTKTKRRRQKITAANNLVDALVNVGIAGLQLLAERWKH